MPGLQWHSHGHTQRHSSAPYPPPLPPPGPLGGPGSSPDPEDGLGQDAADRLPEHPLDSNQSPLLTDAHQLTRMVAMFWLAHSLLNAGNQPDLFDLLASKDNFFMWNIWDKLSDGHTGAKAKDNHKVKHALPHMREWAPSLKDEPKGAQGLSHPECAFFLSPITVDWDDEEQKLQFQEFLNPLMVTRLLQGKLLVMAAKVILKSPSSVLPSVNIWPSAVRRGRRGIAARYQLTHITPQFLAYVAVVTRFAVSAEETFSNDGGVFNYIDFYEQVCEYLEAPRFQAQAQILIAWWNRKLFPDSIHSGGVAGGTGGVQDSMLSLLEAELEAGVDDDDSDV